jgi:ribosomal protein L18E
VVRRAARRGGEVVVPVSVADDDVAMVVAPVSVAAVAIVPVEVAFLVHACFVAMTVAKPMTRAARSAWWNIERIADAGIWPRGV